MTKTAFMAMPLSLFGRENTFDANPTTLMMKALEDIGLQLSCQQLMRRFKRILRGSCISNTADSLHKIRWKRQQMIAEDAADDSRIPLCLYDPMSDSQPIRVRRARTGLGQATSESDFEIIGVLKA